MIALLAAFQFLSIFPPLVKRAFTPQEMGRSTAFYPLVGLALGGILYGAHIALSLVLPLQITSVIIITLWLILTRALHFDGFLDTFDGLFGGWTPEKRLDIMRDSRVGAFGVAAGVLLLLAKYAALISLDTHLWALIVAPVLGRWVMTIAVVAYPYPRDKGLGRDMKDQAGWLQVLIASLITLPAAYFFGTWLGLIAAAVALLFLITAAFFVLRRIPGPTGDIYGALCEGTELLTLILVVAVSYA